MQVDLKSIPGGVLLIEEVTGRKSEALRQEGERDHGRPGNPRLERGDIGLRISVSGELLLSEPGTLARLAEALTDLQRERMVAGSRSG
jgi:hypothetical protein